VVWKQTNPAPANPSPILVGDELYFASDRGIGICLDARTGQEHWKERFGGNYSASPVLADGKLYFSSEQGVTHVVKPSTSFELLASNMLESGIMASPAVVDEALVIRTETHLYRIEKRSAAAGQ
jgi:outer membrane protein assembly factor BamB